MTATKTVQLPVGNLGLQLGNSSRYHQKPCVVHVAQSSQMKGLLEKGDIIVGFQEGKVEHRNPTLSILKRKLDETQHARNRTITVVETKSSYKHSRPVKSNQNQAQLKVRHFNIVISFPSSFRLTLTHLLQKESW